MTYPYTYVVGILCVIRTMVQTVYVAYYGYNYEGSTLVGVFETEQAAEARLGRLKSFYGDYRNVEEVELGEDIEVHL